MANPIDTATRTSERTGVHPSRALMVIPQPPRRGAWRALASTAGRACALVLLIPVSAARVLLASARGAGDLALDCLWVALRGARLLALTAVRGVALGATGLIALAEAGVRTFARGGAGTLRAAAWFAGASGVFVGALAVGLLALAANAVRALGMALFVGSAGAAWGVYQTVRAAGLAAGRVLAFLCAAGAAVGRAAARFLRAASFAVRAVTRVVWPARPGPAAAVAAVAYVALAAGAYLDRSLAHPLLAVPTVVVAAALAGFVVAAFHGAASRTLALALLVLAAVAGIRIAADLAARGGFAGAAGAAVFSLLATHAAARFGRAFARPLALRAPAIARAHRDAGFGVLGVLFAQVATCGVWLAHLPAAERTASLAIDLASWQLVALPFGGWLAASVFCGRRLRAAQVVLSTGLAVVLVLGLAASFRAFGQGRGATPVSLALAGLLAVAATALCLVVRGRIADGSYAGAARIPPAAA